MFGSTLQSPNGQVCGAGGDVVFEALLLQVPSHGYWTAVSISKSLNLG